MKNCLFLFLLITKLSAEVYHVDKSAPPGGDGSSWSSAFQYLQDALDQTIHGRSDEVWIVSGTYYPDEGSSVLENDITASFIIKDTVSLYGGFSGVEDSLSERNWDSNVTTLCASIITNTDPIIFLGNSNNNSINLSNFSDELFKSPDLGGGYRSFNLDGLTIKNIHKVGIQTNSSKYTVSINNCNLIFNSQPIVRQEGHLVLENSKINHNYAVEGPLFLVNSLLSVNCIFSNNTVIHNPETGPVSDDGRGLILDPGAGYPSPFTAINCVFSGNYSGPASLVASSYGGTETFDCTNCVFYENTSILGIPDEPSPDNANGVLGSIVSQHTKFNAQNCTFSGNADVYNNLVHPTDLYDQISNNMVSFIDCTFLSNGNGAADISNYIDPYDGDGADNKWLTSDDGLRLQSSSSAIGAGDPDSLPLDLIDADDDGDTTEKLPYDILGNRRVQGGGLDLGAYEYHLNEEEYILRTYISSDLESWQQVDSKFIQLSYPQLFLKTELESTSAE